jgi:hypothetical protein
MGKWLKAEQSSGEMLNNGTNAGEQPFYDQVV